uniref:Uncharacterized protein n=1 Tax=Cucumis melo TaxID=3656 RepID=A0A9I9DYD4_CUCME
MQDLWFMQGWGVKRLVGGVKAMPCKLEVESVNGKQEAWTLTVVPFPNFMQSSSPPHCCPHSSPPHFYVIFSLSLLFFHNIFKRKAKENEQRRCNVVKEFEQHGKWSMEKKFYTHFRCSAKRDAMEEKAMQREVFEPKCYRVKVSDAMSFVGEEEACFDTKTRRLGRGTTGVGSYDLGRNHESS